MSDVIDKCDDDGSRLEAHQLPVEDIVTAVGDQDPQAFLDVMATILDDANKKDGEA